MAQNIQAALQQLNTLILGKEDVLKQLLACILADGHVLLEDVPGVGKTTLAHGVAAVLGLDYRRVQFTNDMLPSDLLGINIYRPNEGKFEFHPGPVFHSFLLADEINRASPTLQSALPAAIFSRESTNHSPLTVSPNLIFTPSGARNAKAFSTSEAGALKRGGMPIICP